jgi:hypothetical protein
MFLINLSQISPQFAILSSRATQLSFKYGPGTLVHLPAEGQTLLTPGCFCDTMQTIAQLDLDHSSLFGHCPQLVEDLGR